MKRKLILVLTLCNAFGIAQHVLIQQTNSAMEEQSSSEDPVLQAIIQEAVAKSPELAKAQALVEADQLRIPQAAALPDPSLSLGIQNDGFKELKIGKSETSYYQVMLSQPVLWPGKLELRELIARNEAELTRIKAMRTSLSLIADVKRAYSGLLLTRSQLHFLEKQGELWQKAIEIAKLRYETGQGSQADLLRARLEETRFRQSRVSVKAEEKSLMALLNRLRGVPLETAIETPEGVREIGLPYLAASSWLDKAETESPELLAARIGCTLAERGLELAKRSYYPDFAVSAGIMPRGQLDTMWLLGISVSIPVWSRQKQSKAVTEQEFRNRASKSEAENVHNLLVQWIRQRSMQMDASIETLKIYREGLLAQSEAAFQSVLAQYGSGRSSFLEVLQAINTWIIDQSGYLQAIGQAQAIQIAQEEFNINAIPPVLNMQTTWMGGNPASSSVSASVPSQYSGAGIMQAGDSHGGTNSM